MKKYKCLIIDDEEPARLLVKEYLGNNNNFEIIGEARNGLEAVQQINELKPDVVFLDIQMPKLTGFEVLELIDTRPLIVFSTAFDQFAIHAFEKNAVDYLLKPYSQERFSQALNKIIEQNDEQNRGEVNRKMIDSADNYSQVLNRVALRAGNHIKVIPIDEIRYLEADDDYVKIYTGERSYLKEKTMKFFETHLDPGQFVRIHRTYILNVNELDRIERYEKDAYIAILKDGAKLKVSSAGYKLLKDVLKF